MCRARRGRRWNEAGSLIEELRHALLFARARGGPQTLGVRAATGKPRRAIDDRGAAEQLHHDEPTLACPVRRTARSSPHLETCCRGPVELDRAQVPEAVRQVLTRALSGQWLRLSRNSYVEPRQWPTDHRPGTPAGQPDCHRPAARWRSATTRADGSVTSRILLWLRTRIGHGSGLDPRAGITADAVLPRSPPIPGREPTAVRECLRSAPALIPATAASTPPRSSSHRYDTTARTTPRLEGFSSDTRRQLGTRSDIGSTVRGRLAGGHRMSGVHTS